MLAGWVMSAILGNEIRFADEILPGGQDEIDTQSRRNPPLRGGRGREKQPWKYEVRSGKDEVMLPNACGLDNECGIGERYPGGTRTKSCPSGRTKSARRADEIRPCGADGEIKAPHTGTPYAGQIG